MKDLVEKQNVELSVLGSSHMNFASMAKFDTMYGLCERLASMPCLPERYRGRPDRCLLALNMSLRLGEDFFLVAQEMTEVYGMPTMSAEWQTARLNASNFLRGGLKYVWSGEESRDTMACYAVGIRASDGEELKGQAASWKQAEAMGWTKRISGKSGKNTSLWPRMPRLMIHYRATTYWISMFAPHVTGGYIETSSAVDKGPESAPKSPYARQHVAEDADWSEVPPEAEPSLEAPLPNPNEPVGNPAERAASIAAKDWAEAKGREHSASEPVVATFDPCAAVVVDEVGADELKNMDLE